MSVAYEAAEQLFRLGQFGELLRLTERNESLKRLQPRHRLLISEALVLTGEYTRASELLDSVQDSPASETLRAKTHMVRGLVSSSRGRIREALENFRTALRIAEAARDLETAAWAHVRLFRFMIEGHSSGALSIALSEARRAVLRVGNAHLNAYLHQCVAVLEGQAGRLDEGLRHCDISASLLSSYPNAWLEEGCVLNRGCIAAIGCNLDQALRLLSEAKRASAKGMLARGQAQANHILGHVLMLKAEFERARFVLSEAIDSAATSHLSRLAGLDAMARNDLAQGHLAECHQSLEEIRERSSAEAGVATTYHLRWASITRARLLLKRGEARKAVRYLREAEGGARDAKDVPFECAVHITAAQALLRTGNSDEAARRLLAASRLGVTTFRELQGAFYFAASEVAADTSWAEQLATRADRLWATQGIVAVKLEMQAERPPRVAESATGSGEPFGTLALEAMAGAVDLASNPRLLGEELLSAVRAFSTAEAEIIETLDTAPQPKTTAERLSFALGQRKGAHVHLVCRVPEDGDRALRLASILRIGQAALDAERHHQEQRAKAALWPADEFDVEGGGIFISEEMRSLLTMARKVAPTGAAVLITGETGTGKEVLARIIHAGSNRGKGPFVPFNCASTPREMLDSQLFGHRKGAFTGAIENFPGVIRAAAGGTLFLDEIGDMGLDVQPKLLRFLESGEVHPVGEAHPVRTDVRVIAATNANLEALLPQGRFREDLFYRLDIVRLQIPPLRERRVEIPALADHFLQKYGREWGKPDLRLSEESVEYLALYRWPGNVRQLANEMRKMVALAEPGAVLTPQFLSPEVLASRRTIPAAERQLEPSELVVRLDQPMSAATEQLERAMIEFALRQCKGRIEDTAEMLGLSRKGLYLKRHRFGIEPPPSAVAHDADA